MADLVSEAPSWNWWYYLVVLLPASLALFAESVWILGWKGTVDRFAFIAPAGHQFGILYVWTFGAIIPAIGVLITLDLRKQRVSVDSAGIATRSLLRGQRAKWEELRSVTPIVHNQVSLEYFPTGGLFYRSIWLTHDQASVVFKHPRMRAELLNPAHRTWIDSSKH